jgi:hypothetical protein
MAMSDLASPSLIDHPGSTVDDLDMDAEADASMVGETIPEFALLVLVDLDET